MSNEQNKAIVRYFVEEVQNRSNLHVVDECCSQDFVDRITNNNWRKSINSC